MTRALRRGLSVAVGWLADRRIPGPLRAPAYGLYARATGADSAEAELAPRAYPSLGAFFVRRLRPGARPIDAGDDVLVSPCDGKLQALDRIDDGTLLQAKGRRYGVGELLAGMDDGVAHEGLWAWTIYLGPRDYHRVHAPLAGDLVDVRWTAGDRRSVAPDVLERHGRVLATNERVVLRLESAAGPCFLVMVGALNVGRIRVVGVEPGSAPARGAAPRFERGAELARFEMGSTVVLIPPPGTAPLPGEPSAPASRLRMGRAIGSLPA